MANQLLTLSEITRESLRLFRNSNALLRNVSTEYDDQYARTGAKIGSALRIRKPNDYTVRKGAVASPQSTNEQQVTMTVATQSGVDLSFSSVDLALSLDDFSKRVLAPAINNLAGAVAVDLMSGAEGGTQHLAYAADSSGNLTNPNFATIAQTKAILDSNGAPAIDRMFIIDPFSQGRTISSLAGLFNPQSTIGSQYKNGEMQPAVGFDFMMDQTVIKHTVGAYGATPATVNGANQTGTILTVSALPGPLNQGDVVTIDGVYGVNPVNKQSTGSLRQFTLTAPALAGATSINIYPALIAPTTAQVVAGTTSVPFQTVVSLPASGASVRLAIAAGTTFRKNVAFYKEAVTMATADLPLPGKGVVEAVREEYDGVSMRMIQGYDVINDLFVTRLDILYGWLWVRPEWAVAVADVV